MGKNTKNFAVRVLFTRSTYGVYGLILLSANLFFLKWQGARVLVPDILIIMYPLIWLAPVLFSSYVSTNSRLHSQALGLTWIVFCIGGAVWFGYIYRSVPDFGVIAISALMAGLFILFGTSRRWQMAVYWICFIAGEGVGVLVHGQTLVLTDIVAPLNAGVYIFWASIASDLFHMQIEKNKLLMQRMRQDNILIRREQEIVRERTIEIDDERRKSDELLRNILPQKTAEELKKQGYAEPKTFGMVTVLFTDFKDFTAVSEGISPELLVREIDECFSAFDEIMERHHVEKIKTVGDAYIAVAGLPEPSFTHAVDAVRAAVDVTSFMRNRMIEKIAAGEVTFEIRIGIHTGPVVAGIVGRKKFAFDIWGDTVNLAARMEQSSEAGKINISGTTYKLIKHLFNCEYRGNIELKNKGKVDSYFVLSEIAA